MNSVEETSWTDTPWTDTWPENKTSNLGDTYTCTGENEEMPWHNEWYAGNVDFNDWWYDDWGWTSWDDDWSWDYTWDSSWNAGSTRESSRGTETFRDYFYEGFLYIKVVVGERLSGTTFMKDFFT